LVDTGPNYPLLYLKRKSVFILYSVQEKRGWKVYEQPWKRRHLEADQWLNRKEWCLRSGRRRQLSQDRED